MNKKIELVSFSPEEAQTHCNFVIFVPSFLPSGVVMKEQSLRLESKIDNDRSENNRSTFRQVFEGVDRALVIK